MSNVNPTSNELRVAYVITGLFAGLMLAGLIVGITSGAGVCLYVASLLTMFVGFTVLTVMLKRRIKNGRADQQ